jgi:hypothetical protein
MRSRRPPVQVGPLPNREAEPRFWEGIRFASTFLRIAIISQSIRPKHIIILNIERVSDRKLHFSETPYDLKVIGLVFFYIIWPSFFDRNGNRGNPNFTSHEATPAANNIIVMRHTKIPLINFGLSASFFWRENRTLTLRPPRSFRLPPRNPNFRTEIYRTGLQRDGLKVYNIMGIFFRWHWRIFIRNKSNVTKMKPKGWSFPLIKRKKISVASPVPLLPQNTIMVRSAMT